MAEQEKDGTSRESQPEPTPRNAEPERDSSGTNGNSGPPHSVPAAHGHAHGAAHAGHAHGLAHTTPVPLLIGVLATLMLLTVLTVVVTGVDLGAQGNLVVAMVIATIKAALVVMFFMHLVWDKKLHLVLFLTSVLFLILFLSMATTDRGEYQPDLDNFQATEPKS
jgi:cytochrome c oxidase subunit 4